MIEPGVFYYQVTGVSMWPFLRAGARLVVRREPLSSIGVGDIVVYRQADALLCHRVVARGQKDNAPVLLCRGDAALGPSDVVAATELQGKAVAIVVGDRVRDLERFVSRWARRGIVLAAPCIARVFCPPARRRDP